jgi:hypothetical protein
MQNNPYTFADLLLASYNQDEIIHWTEYNGLIVPKEEDIHTTAARSAQRTLETPYQTSRLGLLSDDEILALEEVMDSRPHVHPKKSNASFCMHLRDLDLLFFNEEENCYEIPEEIVKLYRSLESREWHAARRKREWVLECEHAASEIYGAFPLSVLQKLCSLKANGDPGEDLVSYYDSIGEELRTSKRKGNLFFDYTLEEEAQDLFHMHPEIPYRIPSGKEIHDLALNRYPFSSKPCHEFTIWLSLHLGLEKWEAQMTCMQVWSLFTNGGTRMQALHLIRNIEPDFYLKDLMKVLVSFEAECPDIRLHGHLHKEYPEEHLRN